MLDETVKKKMAKIEIFAFGFLNLVNASNKVVSAAPFRIWYHTADKRDELVAATHLQIWYHTADQLVYH